MKKTIYPVIFLCLSAISSASMAAVAPVTDVRASSNYGSRTAANLLNYSNTANGISAVNGFYTRGDGSCWMTENVSVTTLADTHWLAFELAGATDIRGLDIWNMTHSGGYLVRDVREMDMFFLTDAEIAALASGTTFSSYFGSFSKAKLDTDGFTLAGTISLSTREIMAHTTCGQVVDISADAAKWVVFTNFLQGGSDANGTYTGLGKVMFLDEMPRIDIGEAAKKAAAFSSITTNNRGVANLNAGGGLYYRPLEDGSFTVSNYYTEILPGSSWLSDANKGYADKQWLAFELDGPMNLQGMNFWNYAQAHTAVIQRGVKDFEIYTVTQAGVDSLSGFDFDTVFSAETPFATLENLLRDVWVFQGTGMLNPAGGPAGNTYFGDMQYFELETPMEDVALVLMKILTNNAGGADNYVGLGQVRFVGFESFDDDGVPEPATWALMVMGLAGLVFWRRRRG